MRHWSVTPETTDRRVCRHRPRSDVDLGLDDVFFSVDEPFDPNNIGEDADDPTGPLAQLGDKVTFTYKVTNTGTPGPADRRHLR